ncbi:hypothetical protein [Sphingomonas oligophenolica]|uniref:hypothetical protein n=1 Tax=Sphingomonas oligophenolica TaxID=301154 RepID=UPI00112A70EB|nr:hypothetical protein [Sphingomonas oligophenolica]
MERLHVAVMVARILFPSTSALAQTRERTIRSVAELQPAQGANDSESANDAQQFWQWESRARRERIERSNQTHAVERRVTPDGHVLISPRAGHTVRGKHYRGQRLRVFQRAGAVSAGRHFAALR